MDGVREPILVGISFLAGVWCIYRLRKYDLHEKEPWWKMALVTVWGGGWAYLLAVAGYVLLYHLGVKDGRDIQSAFLIIGPVEELAKLGAFWLSYFIFRQELNEPIDGMIYMACVALGFSLLENYQYATLPDSGHLIVIRLLICTPMHLIFSVVMGLAAYLGLHEHNVKGLMFNSIIYAIIMHGLYDSVAFQDISMVPLFIFLGISYAWTKRLLRYVNAISPLKASLSDFIESYQKPGTASGIKCPNCGNLDDKKTYKLGKITLYRCGNCGKCICSRISMHYIFQHFGGAYGRAKKIYNMKDFDVPAYKAFYAENPNWEQKELIYFDESELDRTINRLSRFFISATERKWWFPLRLKKSPS